MLDLDAILATRRKLVDASLASTFTDVGPTHLREAAAWYPEAGGKRLRPVMAMLACEAAGGRSEEALPIALAVELVHNFSLVHDDIMDRDATRRGRATVHVKWDEPTAILAGDVLFARAFEVLARIEEATAHRAAAALLSHAVLQLCEGQALDMAFERRTDVTAEEYLQMIRGKTAVLFEAATKGGALASRDRSPEAVDALARFGLAFGMAFQVADDLLDVTGDAKTLGKPWGSDVRAGKRTLVVLDALEHGARLPALGQRHAADADVRATVDAMRASGALGRAEKARDEWAKAAHDALAELPRTDARDALAAINDWATSRRS